MPANEVTFDKLAIREVIENWVIWSDSGDWERFRTVWHEGAFMSATWFEGPAEDFVRVRREGFERDVSILHFLGGSSIDLAGDRAIAQTKMTISQRAPVDGVPCDVLCTGRFYDFFEKRSGRWAVVYRQPIYEKDRIDPVDPSQSVNLDLQLLNSFPPGYRHLAYIQSKLGYEIRGVRPGLKGPEVEAVYARGRKWLAGGSIS
jgi:SnoaL-like domain